MSGSELELAQFFVQLSEMVVNGGIGAVALNSLAKVDFGKIVVAELEVSPTERVEVGVVLRIELDCLLNHG